MLKQAIGLIQNTAVEAAAARVVEVPGDGRKILVQYAEQLKEVAVPPPCRKHAVHTLADLIEYTLRVIAKIPPDAPPDPPRVGPVVWHGVKGVVLVIDDEDRRDLVTFPLTYSRRLMRLCSLEQDKPTFDQKRFVRLLRTELGLPNEGVVAKFRKLDWKVADEGSGSVQHGKDRMGKSIQAEVQGSDELPEEISVPVPVYQEAGERQEYIVRCAVEIDAINQSFALIPLPEEIQKAIDNAQANIRDRLSLAIGASRAAIYYGAP